MSAYDIERLSRLIGMLPPAPEAWVRAGSTGKAVRVCILDSGVEPNHPMVGDIERAVAVRRGEDDETIVEEDTEGDLCGHGTGCAGIVHSLAPEASLTSVRVLGAGF